MANEKVIQKRIVKRTVRKKTEFKDTLGSAIIKSARLLDEGLDVTLDMVKTAKAISGAIRREIEEF